jgi:predicted permease
MPEPRPPKRLFRFPWRSAERIADEIDSEVEFHLAMREHELRERGLSAAQARVAAHEKFGDVAGMKQYCRALDTRAEQARQTRERLASLAHDIRYAVRQLRRTPAFTLTVVLTLALGIGANIAIMSVVYRLLVAPLPFPDGDRLVTVVRVLGAGDMQVTPTPEVLRAVRERARTFEWAAAFESQEVAVGDPSDSQLLEAVRIEAALMPNLGLRPALGRTFLPEELVPNGPRVTVLGHALWKSRFGGDPAVLGQTLAVDGVPHTIVGVAARDFDVLAFGRWIGGGVWLPFVVDENTRGMTVMGKLRTGVTLAQANQELGALGADLERGVGESPFTLQVMPAKSEPAADTRKALFLLIAAVTVVLLIACANVASLLLIRASARDREIAVRVALGAGRWRLVRQMLTESLLLAMLGGAAGLLVAHYGLQILLAVRPAALIDLASVRLEPVMLGWTIAVSLACGLAFGLAPIMVGAHRAEAALKGGRAASGTAGSRRTRAALVTVEVALSVTLLIGAGLLVQSVGSLQRQDLGFSASSLVSARITLPEGRYASAAARRLAFERLRDDLRRLPAVEAVTMATGLPIRGGARFGTLEAEGRAVTDEQPAIVSFVEADADYFRLTGIQLREGTTFGDDTAGVAIISDALARRLWPGQSAVGRRFRVGERGSYSTVVGVVNNVRAPGRTGGALELQMYVPFSGRFETAHAVMRTRTDDAPLLGPLMRIAGDLDPTITVRSVQPVEELLAAGIAAERFNMRLLSGFALMALVLSAIGLYGVIAYGVAQRTRELGMRIALGAMQRDVLAMVVRQGLRLSVIGVVLGFAAAAAATRAMESMLFEVSPLDPATFAGVGILIVGVSLLASWLPARRAARVDPIAALRAE